MDTRFLGRTGIRVSPLCLGCMMFGGRTNPSDSARTIDRAIDAGINFNEDVRVRHHPLEPARRRLPLRQVQAPGLATRRPLPGRDALRAPALLGSSAAFDAVEALEAVAREKSVSLSQLSIGWVAQQPHITSPIIGPRTLEQLEDNLKALELKLGKDDLARIDRISPPGGVIVPFYQAAFGPGEHRS